MINEQRRRVAPPSGAEADETGNTASGDGNRRVSPDGTASGDGSRRVSPDTPRTTTNTTVFDCLLNSNANPKIVKTSSPNQARQGFSDGAYYFFSNYYFQTTDKDGKFDKNKHYKGTWKCDGDKDYIINTEDGDEYSSKTGKWKGVPNNNNNNNDNNNNNNNTGLVDTNLTGDELKAGKVVKMGMKGPIVGTIQDLLIKLGYTNVSSSGKADSKFGKRTKQMVKDFQTNNGLNDDGEVGKNTWSKLNDPNAVGASSSSPSSSAIQATSTSKPDEVAGSDAIIIQEERKKLLRKYLLQFK